MRADLLLRTRRASEVAGALRPLEPLDGLTPSKVRKALRLATRVEDHALAVRASEALLTRRPSDSEGVLLGARARWRLGRQDEADDAVQRWLAEDPTARSAAAADFLMTMGEGLRAATLLLNIDTPADDLFHLGKRILDQGHLRAGLEVLDAACLKDPTDEKAPRLRRKTAGRLRLMQGTRVGRAPVGRFRPVSGRVLHVISTSLLHKQNGYTIRTHNLLRSQRRAGVDAQALTQLGFASHGRRVMEGSIERLNDVPYHRLSEPAELPEALDQRFSLNVSAAATLLQEVRPSVLHATTDYYNGLLALELRRSSGLPVIYEVRSIKEATWLSQAEHRDDESDFYHYHSDIELRCMMEADHVVTLGATMKEHIVGRGVPAEKVTVVPNGVDVSRFRPPDRDDALAARLGIRREDFVVGVVSSLARYEGIEYLITAVSRLRAGGHSVRALIVGEGEQRRSLELHAACLGVEEHVRFAGRVPHESVLPYYGLIDVFAIPRPAMRVSELVTPLKPFEAMACGRAMVVSRLPALHETVSEGETGLCFRPDDADDLARTLESLVDDPGRRHELGCAARRWVCEHRTWEGVVDRYRSIYDGLGVPSTSLPAIGA
jgi:glycosyltransferase involved in cell wall biosynthesis